MKCVCDVCGWEYDETIGYEDGGITFGTKFDEQPEDFVCPLCGVGKDMFSFQSKKKKKFVTKRKRAFCLVDFR